MTSTKKKVVKIYPDAVCYQWAGDFCIFKEHGGDIVSSYSSKQYSGWFKTEQEAWENAWHWIQEKTLQKLEG